MKANTKKNIIIVGLSLLVIFLLSFHAVKHIIKNHPHEYIYFNELAGGVDNAYGNYELDYYYHTTRAASEWIIENVAPIDGEKVVVAAWHPFSVNYFFRKDTANFKIIFNRWYERGNTDWDYAIYCISGMMPEEIKNENFPPKNAVHTVMVDDTPVAFVLKRETKDDLLAFQLKQNKQYAEAIAPAQRALLIDPTNVSNYLVMIESYYYLQKLDSVKIYVDKLLEYVPRYESANYFLAHYYLSLNNMNSAIDVCYKILNDNFKFVGAYHLLYQIYAQSGEIKKAEDIMIKMLEAEQLDEKGFQQLLNVYKSYGMDDRAAYKKIVKIYIEHYEATGNQRMLELYQNALKN